MRFKRGTSALTLLLMLADCHKNEAKAPSAPVQMEFTLFEGGGFSFSYPSDWKRITDDDIDAIWGDLKSQIGVPRQKLTWFGGVYTGSLDPSQQPNSAALFALVGKIPWAHVRSGV